VFDHRCLHPWYLPDFCLPLSAALSSFWKISRCAQGDCEDGKFGGWNFLACDLLKTGAMTSSFESIYKKMAAGENHQEERSPEPGAPFDPAKHVSPVIAHELNNILAIVQGYADRLILKYAGDAALHSQLKMITEAARRAAAIVRDATPPPSSQAGTRVLKPKPEPSLA
jgi:hypothetical protein